MSALALTRCLGDTEIAIQEEVAQTPALEFGVGWFDVGEFADDCVLVHDGLHRCAGASATIHERPNFRQRRIVAFTA